MQLSSTKRSHNIGCWTRRAHMRSKNWRSMTKFDAISLPACGIRRPTARIAKEMLSALPRAERVAAYSAQLSNVRSALEWSFGSHGNDEIATRLAVASTQLFMELSLLIECQVWAERAIARLGDQHKNPAGEMEIYASYCPLAMMHTEGQQSARSLELFPGRWTLRSCRRILPTSSGF